MKKSEMGEKMESNVIKMVNSRGCREREREREV